MMRPFSIVVLALSVVVLSEGTLFSASTSFSESTVAALPEAAWLEDASRQSGIDFVHFSGMSGRLYYVEVVGSGGALLDYDNDGDLDLYLVQGAMLGADLRSDQATFPWRGEQPPRDRLYRNDLVIGPNGERQAHFVDVTDQSGIRAERYGIGATAGDFDNDGWVDLYVLNFGRNELWRNRGDGTFEEVARAAGVDDERFSVSASFADFDADGWLDLFVADYLDYSLVTHKVCLTERGEPDYCLPAAYEPVADRLYRNRGDGTFEDVSKSSGIGAIAGNGLGVISADFDGNGWIDFYVANDLMPNHLWLNQGDGTFVEDGLLMGVAVNAEGRSEASMGIAVGDPDNDGDWDLFLTHFRREKNTFYRNDGGVWADHSESAGLAQASWPHTAFGTVFVDFDHDGWLDLFVANGAVTFPPGSDRRVNPFPLDEPNQLFRNRGDGRFEEASQLGGEAFLVSAVSRGVVAGDLDNDGDTDLVVTNNSGPTQTLLNRVGQDAGWLGLRLAVARPREGGERPLRDAFGAEVRIERVGAPALLRRVQADGSYASSSDPRIVIGTDKAKVSGVVVRWVGGAVERFAPPPSGAYTTLVQGRGMQP